VSRTKPSTPRRIGHGPVAAPDDATRADVEARYVGTDKQRTVIAASPAMVSALDGRCEPVAPAGKPIVQITGRYVDNTEAVGLPSRRKGPDDAQKREVQRAIDRLAALDDIRSAQGRLSIDTGQAYTIMALGAELVGGKISNLAPTKQIGEWAMRRGRRAAWLVRPQVVALCVYHSLHLMSLIGKSGVDPEAVRVDGGGGGSIEFALSNAMDAERSRRRASASLPRMAGHPLQAQLVDWVVIHDRPIDDFKIGNILKMSADKSLAIAKRTLFWEASTHLADHFGS